MFEPTIKTTKKLTNRKVTYNSHSRRFERKGNVLKKVDISTARSLKECRKYYTDGRAIGADRDWYPRAGQGHKFNRSLNECRSPSNLFGIIFNVVLNAALMTCKSHG